MDSYLYLALVDDDIDVLKGKDWLKVRDQLTAAKNTVLHLACQNSRIECVQEILSADESLLLQINSRDDTALHLAARRGHYGVVEALIIKAKSMVLQCNNFDTTSSTVLQILIRARNMEYESALHAAVRYNHKDVVELLVKEDPSYSYPGNKYNETPLYLAAFRCYAGATKVILENCESPTFGGPDGRTALHAALMTADESECIKLLLGKEKDLIKVADNYGWTAFHYVAHYNLHSSLGYLLSVDKSVAYLPDKKYKRTPVHIAAYKGHHTVAMELLKYLPDAWECVDGNGQNILHIAVTQNQKDFMEYFFSHDILNLVTRNTLLNQRDKEGNTPVHLIAKFGCYFSELKNSRDWNVDWDVVGDRNFTPVQMLYHKHNGTLIDEELVGVTSVDRFHAAVNWYRWTNEGPEKYDPVESHTEKITRYRQMANTHMIVTALITTVALTAGFTTPGGFDGNSGPNQGSAVLSKKTAFKTFMIADTITLVLSMSSLFLYFLTSFKLRTEVIFNLLISAIVLNVLSIAAMMVSFIAGTWAVLSHSSGLTISVCIISSLFLVLVISVCFIPLRRMLRAMTANPFHRVPNWSLIRLYLKMKILYPLFRSV